MLPWYRKKRIFDRRVGVPSGIFSQSGISANTVGFGAHESRMRDRISRALVQKCRAASGLLGFKEKSAPCHRSGRSAPINERIGSSVVDRTLSSPSEGSGFPSIAFITLVLLAASRSERSRTWLYWSPYWYVSAADSRRTYVRWTVSTDVLNVLCEGLDAARANLSSSWRRRLRLARRGCCARGPWSCIDRRPGCTC